MKVREHGEEGYLTFGRMLKIPLVVITKVKLSAVERETTMPLPKSKPTWGYPKKISLLLKEAYILLEKGAKS